MTNLAELTKRSVFIWNIDTSLPTTELEPSEFQQRNFKRVSQLPRYREADLSQLLCHANRSETPAAVFLVKANFSWSSSSRATIPADSTVSTLFFTALLLLHHRVYGVPYTVPCATLSNIKYMTPLL